MLSNYGVEAILCSNLKHPYALTYEHRKLFAERIELYDFFWYAEDDLLIQDFNLIWYFDVLESMWPNGCSAFVRTESRSDGTLVHTDSLSVVRRNAHQLLCLESRKFLVMDNQYHACWGLPQDLLKYLIKEEKYSIIENSNMMREHAASFLIWTLGKPGWIEISDNAAIHSNCMIKHLSNNYVNMPGTQHGKIAIDGIIILS
jgi:hypothetical protein